VDRGGGLYLARIDGSGRRRVASKPDGADPIEALRFSPDARLLAFAAQGPGGAGHSNPGETLYTLRLADVRRTAISFTGMSAR
jgi:hypothetical protein